VVDETETGSSSGDDRDRGQDAGGDKAPREHESAEATVERIVKELETGESSDGDESEEDTEEGEPQSEQIVPDRDEIPPQRFKAHEKEVFNRLPKPLKRAVHETIDNLERMAKAATQEARREAAESRAIREAVRPYLLQKPELMEAGYSESQFVRDLVAAHINLTNSERQRGSWLAIGAEFLKPDELQKIQQIVGGAAQQGAVAQTDPALQQRLNRLESILGQQEQQQTTQAANHIINEVEGLRQQTDNSGRYLYPELHDGAYLQQVKPLVSALVGTTSCPTYADAFRQAVLLNRGQQGGNGAPAQVNQASLPPQATKAAAISVRGKSTAPSRMEDIQDIPKEALTDDPEGSLRWALKQLSGR
jgi:hypothetical protein